MKKRFAGMWILGFVAGLLLAVNTPWNIHAEEKLTNGTCGESATWEYNTQTKTLTIRGTGVVSGGNFQEDEWFLEKNSDKVEKLVISEGITSISGETFRDGAMKEVALPDTLKKIGANAFYHCQSLKRITIPEGVTTVGSGVFTSCRDLAYVKLPKTLKTNPNKIGLDSIFALKKVVNHSKYNIKMSTFGKKVTWKVNGKKVTTIKSGKTGVSTGKKYKITYKTNGATLKGKKKKSYRFGDIVYIKTTAVKKNAHFLQWEMTKGDIFFEGKYDPEEGEPARGNVTVKPCFLYYNIKQTGKKTAAVTINASEAGGGVVIRYYTDKTKKAQAGTQSFYVGSTDAPKGKKKFKFKNLETGKKYYFDVRLVNDDSDWDEDKEVFMSNDQNWFSIGSLTLSDTKAEKSFTLSAAGDCTFASDIKQPAGVNFFSMYKKKNASYFLKKVQSVFAKDDLTLVNFEGTLSNGGKRVDKTWAFRGKPAYVDILTKGSVEAVSFSNNHTRDYGAKSHSDTMKILKNAGVTYSTETKAAIKMVNGVKVGLASISSIEAKAPKAKLKKSLKELKEQKPEVIIVSMHSGIEYTQDIQPIQKRLAHLAIDMGADVVIGHHPHVMQGIDRYKGKYIVYSLGNFCFGGNTNPPDKDAMIFQQTFRIQNGKLKISNTKVVPVRISGTNGVNNYQPVIAKGKTKTRIIKRLNRYSKGNKVTIDKSGYIK